MSEIERLREALRKFAVNPEYDFPGDAPVYCGQRCDLCGQHVSEDGIVGHADDCLLALASSPPGAERGEWKGIESALKMKTLLLFAVTDIDEAGVARNWKMESGFWHSGAECWVWGGEQVRKYAIQPTHWQPLPAPPSPPASASA